MNCSLLQFKIVGSNRTVLRIFWFSVFFVFLCVFFKCCFSIFSSSVFVLFLFSSLFFCHVFFRSLDDEILLPMACDVEAVGRHDYNMILRFAGFAKGQSGSRSCRVMSKANVFFWEGSIEMFNLHSSDSESSIWEKSL